MSAFSPNNSRSDPAATHGFPRAAGLVQKFPQRAACQTAGRCYRRTPVRESRLLPDSSAVEHSTVNRMAVGSNPTRGATFFGNVAIFQALGNEEPKSPPHFTPHRAPIATGWTRTMASSPQRRSLSSFVQTWTRAVAVCRSDEGALCSRLPLRYWSAFRLMARRSAGPQSARDGAASWLPCQGVEQRAARAHAMEGTFALAHAVGATASPAAARSATVCERLAGLLAIRLLRASRMRRFAMMCQILPMPASTSRPEPSVTAKDTSTRTSIFDAPPLPPEEVARRARDAQRLKEAYSSIPWHARKADRDPAYWRTFLMSAFNAYSVPD